MATKPQALVIKSATACKWLSSKVATITGNPNFGIIELDKHFPKGFVTSAGTRYELAGKPTHAVFASNKAGHWVITGFKQDKVEVLS